jgi:hypothetical protein
MAKIPPYTPQMFAQNAGTGEVAEYGSEFSGSPQTVPPTSGYYNLDAIQANPNFKLGWMGAVLDGNVKKLPTLEDANALDVVALQSLHVIYQQGALMDYASNATNYTIGTLIKDPTTNDIYISLVDPNINQPLTDITKWKRLGNLEKLLQLENFNGNSQIVKTDSSGLILSSNLPDSSETAKGAIEIATQTEVNTGTDDVKAITPLKLNTFINNLGFANSKTPNGYTYLPNGYIWQWCSGPVFTGEGSGIVNFLIPFPNTCLQVLVSTKNNTNDILNNNIFQEISHNTTSVTVFCQTMTSGSTINVTPIIFAIGC